MADTGDILIHLEYIRKAADETNDHLRALNGRVSAVEIRATVLETRADEGKSSGRNWGLSAGGIGTAIGAALAHFFGGSK